MVLYCFGFLEIRSNFSFTQLMNFSEATMLRSAYHIIAHSYSLAANGLKVILNIIYFALLNTFFIRLSISSLLIEFSPIK